jgi:hypothetical protein
MRSFLWTGGGEQAAAHRKFIEDVENGRNPEEQSHSSQGRVLACILS